MNYFCTVNVLVPADYAQSWSMDEISTFKQRLEEISQLEFSCNQASEFESALADDIYSLFRHGSS